MHPLGKLRLNTVIKEFISDVIKFWFIKKSPSFTSNLYAVYNMDIGNGQELLLSVNEQTSYHVVIPLHSYTKSHQAMLIYTFTHPIPTKPYW